MWKLYCLPGRAIAELGFLFPGKGQLWASQRRRESGVAAFLYATGFWIVLGIFGLPMIAGVVGALAHRQSVSDLPSSRVSVPIPTSSVGDSADRNHDIAITESTNPSITPQAPVERSAKPRIVFAPPREVVQPLPASTPSERAN